MTRGRTANVLHVVAVDEQDAREQFIDAFARDSADRGLDEARKQVERDMHGIIAGNAAQLVEPFADPLPQAFILTAIVIGFGLQAFAVVLIKRAYQTVGTDDLDDMTTTDT